jgi:hypothetical protein
MYNQCFLPRVIWTIFHVLISFSLVYLEEQTIFHGIANYDVISYRFTTQPAEWQEI